jgi:predicted Zn-dependent peptidase
MGIIDQLLLQGDDSMLREALVQERGFTSSVDGGINLLGNMFNYKGPMVWMGYLFHDRSTPMDSIKMVMESVIEKLRSAPVDQATLDRAKIKFRSDLYSTLGTGFGRADLLASFALFDDDPSKINTIETMIDGITPEIVQRTAQEYLRSTNQTILTINPTKVLSKEERSYAN